MHLTCPLLLLFVLKLENHLSQELEILYRAWAQKLANTYCFLCFLFFGLESPHSPTPHPHCPIWILVKIHLLESSKLEL